MESISNIFKPMNKPDVIIFVVQVLMLFIVVCTSLVNLSLNIGNTDLWTMILTSCLGYMMPNPRFKVVGESVKVSNSVSSQTVGQDDGLVLRDLAVQREIKPNK